MSDTDDGEDSRDGETPGAAAHYIGSLAEELSHIARRNGLESLSYILDMARLEADQISKSSKDARSPRS
ncbi:MAG TPA: hypothetical protein VMJ52_13890 [Xanthobacteraceae bacterium]|nr:hypothetical protein [Xanthobacteraceae bacterium]